MEWGGLRGLGNSEALPWEQERAWTGKGLPHSPAALTKGLGRQFWWEGGCFPGGRGKPCGGAVGPAAMQWGEERSRSGWRRGAPPSSQQPLLWWESLW